MEQWEYRIAAVDYWQGIDEVDLQALGEAGWEMCGTHVRDQGRMALYYFKRRKP